MGRSFLEKSNRTFHILFSSNFKVLEARDGELKWLKKNFVLTSISVFLVWLAPLMITTAIFGVYILTGHEMNAKTAFTLISTIMIIQQPLKSLPFMLSLMIESKISLTRVTKYLLAEEVQRDFITRNDSLNTDISVKVQNGNFYWLSEEEKQKKKEKEHEEKKEQDDQKDANSDKEHIDVTSHNDTPYKLVLQDINVEIKKGSFVAILGEYI